MDVAADEFIHTKNSTVQTAIQPTLRNHAGTGTTNLPRNTW